MHKIEHPAVWRGEELLQRPDWLQEWTDEELQQIDALEPPDSIPDRVAPDFCRRMRGIQESLEHGSGASMIRGLHVSDHSVETWMQLFRKVASLAGHPVSQSAAGERIFSVRNAGFADDDPRARGPNTKKKLSFHTDRCDVIGFLCLQQARSGGENQVVSSATLFNEIRDRRPDLLQVLMEPFYYQRHNVDTANELPYTRQPVFSFFEGHFAANFLRVLIERAHANPDLPDLSERQREALDFLEQVAAEPSLHVTFRQQPGDILFLNNWVTLHRRTAFEDYEEPRRRRHILRVWLSMPNSRPLDPMFAGNYGATTAGSIRGGMRAAH
jgi:alpha-ketoglutarate-dependent taurine dioxygenase